MMNVKANLIAIDQSLTATGIAIHDNNKFEIKLLKTKKNKSTKAPSIDYTKRIATITNDIEELCKAYNIKYAIIEGLSYGSRSRAMYDLGGLSHAIRMIFLDLEIKFAIIPPSVAKKYWTGNGGATKADMIQQTKNRGIEIPLIKKYGKGQEDIDDNCNDAVVFLIFLIDLLTENLDEGYKDKIEMSWEF